MILHNFVIGLFLIIAAVFLILAILLLCASIYNRIKDIESRDYYLGLLDQIKDLEKNSGDIESFILFEEQFKCLMKRLAERRLVNLKKHVNQSHETMVMTNTVLIKFYRFDTSFDRFSNYNPFPDKIMIQRSHQKSAPYFSSVTIEDGCLWDDKGHELKSYDYWAEVHPFFFKENI